MADLTEKIDDLICSFEGGGDLTMDTVAMLIFGWAVFGVMVLAISKYVYGRYFAGVAVTSEPTVVKKAASVAETSAPAVTNVQEQSKNGDGEKVAPKSEGGLVFSKMSTSRSGGKFVPPTPPLRKRLSTKKGSGPAVSGSRTLAHIIPPSAAGPDSECVHWINELFTWLYSNSDAVDDVFNVWLQCLNDYTKKSVVEVSIIKQLLKILT